MGYRHQLAARTQFVLVAVCGCPLDVREGSTVPGPESALREFADHNPRRVLDWLAEGRRVVHVSQDQYEQVYLRKMQAGCTHRGKS